MSCGCANKVSGSTNKVGEGKEGVGDQIFVFCPTDLSNLGGLSNAQNLKVPIKSYWWNTVHRYVCDLEKRTGSTPHWSYKFYRDSFPGRNCKGLECEKYV